MAAAFFSRFRRLFPFVFAIILGVGAVVVMNSVITNERRAIAVERQRLYKDYVTPVDVVVASKDIREGTTIDTSHVKIASVPEKFLQPFAARGAHEILGKVTLTPIAEGEQILLNKVRLAEAVPMGATLSSITPKGKRAVTIGVDAVTGVGGFVRPGDTVDVLWTIQLPTAPPAPGAQPQSQVFTVTLFQEVPVLAVGREIMGRATGTTDTSNQFTVTLGLDPQGTSFLLFAREQGRIQLSLRARQDEGTIAVAPATIDALVQTVLGSAAMPQAPAAPATREVEVYKGLKRDVVLLPEDR